MRAIIVVLLVVIVILMGGGGLLLVGAGLGGAILFALLPILIAIWLLRGMANIGAKIADQAGPELLPGQRPTGDRVERVGSEWWVIVGDRRLGPWSDRTMAENILTVEQRRVP